MPTRRSLVAYASAWLGAIALLVTLAGVGGAAMGWLAPMAGFTLFLAGGLLLGGATLVLGLVGLLRTGAASGRAGRAPALLGTAIGALLVVILAGAASPGRGLPRINDITTDPADPPRFGAAARELGAALDYPGEAFAAEQRRGYPDLAPIELALLPAEAFERAHEAARSIGLEIVAADPAAGHIEARQTSRLFRFVDDVVIRVRPAPAGARIDVRSRSRDGRGDLGANAARIRALAAGLR